MPDNELKFYLVKDEPPQWSLTGEFSGISVRGLSSHPNKVEAEVYDTVNKNHALLGSVSLHHSGEQDSRWVGLEQLMDLIQKQH